MKRPNIISRRVALETAFFLVFAGFLLVALARIQPAVSVSYKYDKGIERTSSLPLEIKTESKYLRIKGSITLPAIHGSLFILRPDDCLEKMVVNGKELPSDDVKFCHARPGRRVNLSQYVFPGENTIEWVVRDTGGTGGMAMPLSWLDPVFLCLFATLILLSIVFGSRLILLLSPKPRSALILFFIIVVALLIRLSLSWHPGYGYDMKLNKRWARSTVEMGIGNAYRTDPTKGARPNYPPLNLVILAGTHYAYSLAASLPPSPTWSVWYHAAMKLPAILTDAILCYILFLVCASCFSRRHGLIAAAVYALHPAAIYLSAVWGQTDAIYTMFLSAGLLAAIKKRWLYFGAFFAIAMLLKVQSVILLPFVILFLFERGAWWRMAMGALVCATLVLLPFALSRTLQDVLHVYLSSVGFYHSLTMSADNLWVILFGTSVDKSSVDVIMGLSFRTAGFLLFASVVSLLLAVSYKQIAYWRRDKRYGATLFLLSSLIAFAFFFFNAEMHERYLFPFVALGLPFIFIGKRGVILYGLASMFFVGNLSHVLQLGSVDRLFWKALPDLRSFIASGLLFVFVMLVHHYWHWVRVGKVKAGA